MLIALGLQRRQLLRYRNELLHVLRVAYFDDAIDGTCPPKCGDGGGNFGDLCNDGSGWEELFGADLLECLCENGATSATDPGLEIICKCEDEFVRGTSPLPAAPCDLAHPYHPCAQKSSASLQLAAAFSGQDPDDYFKETVLEGEECPSDDPCFARDTLALLPSGERVPMASLKAGDLVMDGPSSVARVIVNQHREATVPPSPLYHPLAVTTNTRAATLSPQPISTPSPSCRQATFKSALLELEHANGILSLTPDHVLEVDGKARLMLTPFLPSPTALPPPPTSHNLPPQPPLPQFVPARMVAAGSKLGESEVSRVVASVGEVINPLTTSGKILTQGGVLASTYPEWVAEYMLSSYLVPLPLSLSNLLSYLFPETAQARLASPVSTSSALLIPSLKEYGGLTHRRTTTRSLSRSSPRPTRST